MLGPEYPTYFLDRRPGEPASDEIDRIGGLPRGVALESWPRSPDGVPMIHLLTVEVRERRILSGPRAVAVFVTSIGDFSAFQEGERQACIVPLSDQDLARGVLATVATDVLQACTLSVSAFGTVRCAASDGQVELGWEWGPGIDAEPIGKRWAAPRSQGRRARCSRSSSSSRTRVRDCRAGTNTTGDALPPNKALVHDGRSASAALPPRCREVLACVR
jgi:hypothetical protein